MRVGQIDSVTDYLHNAQDAEDAFQAVLDRRAGGVTLHAGPRA
jgi:hypothetical protein